MKSYALFVIGSLLASSIACAPRQVGITPQPTQSAADTRLPSNGATPSDSGRTPIGDPIAYMRESQRRAAALEQYQVTFIRQERLGVIPSVHAVERINAWFRARPFSVKFEWQGNDTEFREAAYLAGSNKDMVLLLRRIGLLGFKPGVERYDPDDSVKFGKSRNPMTDFGLDRMMQRTLRRIEDAEPVGGATVKYMGIQTLEGVAAHHLCIDYPHDDRYPNKRQDLYVEVASGLPLGVYLWLPNGELDAMYLYLDRRTCAEPLADDVFTIHRPSAKAGKSRK